MQEHLQYLTFEVGAEEYGVPIMKVREIMPFASATRLPSTPAWIRGVVNLRGLVLPVLDLGVKFGLPATETTSRACVIVFEIAITDEPQVVGALVDAVSQVLDLTPDEIELPPSFGTQIRVEYLAGATASNGKFVLLLDTDRVLTADELLAVREATSAASPAG
jgi:purine-binding chemotaxis protein CheW